MEKLQIKGTKSTPEVIFDPDHFSLVLKGQSYPENAYQFYEPIFQWVDQFIEQLDKEILVVIDFHLPYINSSSSKCLMMLLDKFDLAYEQGKKIRLNWYYNEDNDSELECAEEFTEDLTLPFDLIPRVEAEDMLND